MLERSYEKLKELTRAQDSKRDRGLRGSTLGFSESCFWSQSTYGASFVPRRVGLFSVIGIILLLKPFNYEDRFEYD